MKTLLRLLSGIYFLLIAVYCFTAFNSYTYFFLVKAPPYRWLSWFAGHASLLYWIAFAAVCAAFWQQRRRLPVAAALILQMATGILFTWYGAARNLENDWSAYVWSLAILCPMLLAYGNELIAGLRSRASSYGSGLLPYSNAVLAGCLVALLSLAGTHVRHGWETKALAFHLADLELAALVAVADVWLAIFTVSLLNLVQLAARRRFSRPGAIRPWMFTTLVFLVVQAAIVRFLRHTLSFTGWAVALYACVLAAAVTCWGFSILAPVIGRGNPDQPPARSRKLPLLLCLCLGIAAVSVPAAIGSGDWNGLLEGTFGLILWVLMGVLVYVLRPHEENYSLPAVLAVLLVSSSLYWGVNSSAFVWARQLGATEHEVATILDAHQAENASYGLVKSVFARRIDDTCDQYCRTLRQFTNIRNARAKTPLMLVDQLAPTTGERPNIFILVIDSLRPDYLGAYNPAVDFTPNLDRLAADSAVMRKAFTQYAGTSLSEPAIWAGAMLLHSHYMRPFENVNSLRTLARTDGYQLMVSNDDILQRILSAQDDIVRLDLGRNNFEIEISSTLRQLTQFLETRPDNHRPVLFYTQPMNVHELGITHLPERTAANWRPRLGFNDRIAFRLSQVDDALGKFVAYLKANRLYESSLIIVTADHGDGNANLPGFGFARRNHSLILFPEVMRVPLIIHLPPSMRSRFVCDENRLSPLTDITPSLYRLLGHGPIRQGAILGRPLFAASAEELSSYDRSHLLLASDTRAAYGILSADARFMYVAYDSPRQSLLFDLFADPEGRQNLATPESSAKYDEQIVEDLQALAGFYGFVPDGGSSAKLEWDR